MKYVIIKASKKDTRLLKKQAIDISASIMDRFDKIISKVLNNSEFNKGKLNTSNVLATIESDLNKLEDKLSNAIVNNVEATEDFE